MDRTPRQSTRETLARAREGDEEAVGALMESIYADLRGLASSHLAREASFHTLQPTALIHEAFLRLVGQRTDVAGRTHFVALASIAMRRVLIDHARSKKAAKRGGGAVPLSLVDDVTGESTPPVDPAALCEALQRLEAADARQARVVEMRFFGGMGDADIAERLGVSERTVRGDWAHARAWLRRELSERSR